MGSRTAFCFSWCCAALTRSSRSGEAEAEGKGEGKGEGEGEAPWPVRERFLVEEASEGRHVSRAQSLALLLSGARGRRLLLREARGEEGSIDSRVPWGTEEAGRGVRRLLKAAAADTHRCAALERLLRRARAGRSAAMVEGGLSRAMRAKVAQGETQEQLFPQRSSSSAS